MTADHSLEESDRIKVLHVVQSLDRGGIETWLANVARLIDQTRFEIHVLKQTEAKSDLDSHFRENGATIHSCSHPAKILANRRDIRRVIKTHGPFDIIHSHVRTHGNVLRIARNEGIQVRIAHCHTTRLGQESFAGRTWTNLVNIGLKKIFTHGIACSTEAANAFFGKTWQNCSTIQVLYCGIDLRRFREQKIDPDYRRTISVPDDAFVIGHVGSIREEKNHKFLLHVTRNAVQLKGNVWLVLAGDGPLRSQTEELATSLGVRDRVLFLGTRDDVPNLMVNVFDAFVFPSLWEGLGLAVHEALAAGLPCIIADNIPEEADVVPKLVRRLSLESDSVESWARAVLRTCDDSRSPHDECCEIIRNAGFDVVSSVRNLEELYKRSIADSSD